MANIGRDTGDKEREQPGDYDWTETLELITAPDQIGRLFKRVARQHQEFSFTPYQFAGAVPVRLISVDAMQGFLLLRDRQGTSHELPVEGNHYNISGILKDGSRMIASGVRYRRLQRKTADAAFEWFLELPVSVTLQGRTEFRVNFPHTLQCMCRFASPLDGNGAGNHEWIARLCNGSPQGFCLELSDANPEVVRSLPMPPWILENSFIQLPNHPVLKFGPVEVLWWRSHSKDRLEFGCRLLTPAPPEWCQFLLKLQTQLRIADP